MEVFNVCLFFFIVDKIILKRTSTVKEHTSKTKFQIFRKSSPLVMNNSILPWGDIYNKVPLNQAKTLMFFFFIVLNVVIFLNVNSTKIDQVHWNRNSMCFSSNVMNYAVLLKVTYTKKIVFCKDRLWKILYWMVANKGIPLKATYTIKVCPT